MPRLTVTRGLPGSGKSTWARKRARKNPDLVVVHFDALPLAPPEGRRQLAESQIRQHLRDGYSVIYDFSGLDPERIEALRQLARSEGSKFAVKDFTHVPLSTCITRAMRRKRTQRIGLKVTPYRIRQLHQKYIQGA